jgi:hypothetical protein
VATDLLAATAGVVRNADAVARTGATSTPRSYRPAAIVKLSIRLEDFGNDDGAAAATERRPFKTPAARAAAALDGARAELAVLRASGAATGADEAKVRRAERAASRAGGARATAPPDNAAADLFAVVLALVPQEMGLELNGFTIADKLQCSFQLRDLPIVPDVARAILAEVYMGNIPPADFGDPSRWVPSLLGTPPMFRGYVDVHDVTGDDGDAQVQLQARSLEARLMDAKVDPRRRDRLIRRNDAFVDGRGKTVRGEKLTAYLRRFLSTIPEFSGALGGDAIGVRIWPNFDPAREPILGADTLLRSLQTAQSRAQAGGQVQGAPPLPAGQDPGLAPGVGSPTIPPPTPAMDLSAWDVVVRACELSGFVPIYDPSIVGRDAATGDLVKGADNILLVLPQTIMETPQDGLRVAGGPHDGFSREFVERGTTRLRSEVRFMVWGSNVKNLKFSRKHGRIKAPAVRVVCHDPDGPAGGRTLSSTFPATPRGTRVSALGTGGPGAGGAGRGHAPVEELVTKVVHGVRSQAQLDRIAVSLYHSVSRQEVSCEIETDDMSSYVDPSIPDGDADVLRLRPGTPVRVAVAREVEDPAQGLQIGELSELFERRANPAFMRKLLLGESARRVGLSDEGRRRLEQSLERVEAAYARARLTEWFYTRVVNHKFSVDDGWSATMELVNFLEARSLPANLGAGDAARAELDNLAKAAVDRASAARDRAVAAGFASLASSLARGRR